MAAAPADTSPPMEQVGEQVAEELLRLLDKHPRITTFHGREVGGGHVVVAARTPYGEEIREDGAPFPELAVRVANEAIRRGWCRRETLDLQLTLA